jgi:DNA-binding transcriptional LysR family regulator
MSAQLRVSLRQLEYLVAVSAHGTMSAAAEHCRVSQSAVSLAIAQLERSLRVELFLRHRSKGMTLTLAGHKVVADARRLLAQADELQSSARSLGQDLTGRLVIGCFPTLTPYIMPITLDDFGREHAAIEIDFIEGSVSQLHESLLNGTCEMALMYDIGLQPDLRTETLYEVRPHVILPAHHRLAGSATVRLADLADEPMIMLDMHPSEEHFRSVFAEAGVTPRIARRTVSAESVRALVAGGAGYSVLLQRAASSVSYSGLPFVTSEIEEAITPTAVQLVAPASARLTRRALAFREFCRAYYAEQGRPAPGVMSFSHESDQ